MAKDKTAKVPRASAFLIRSKETGEFLTLVLPGAWQWTSVVGEALQFVRDVDAKMIAARFIVQGYTVVEKQL